MQVLPSEFPLPASLGVVDVEDLKKSIRALLSDGDIRLEGTKVERVSTCSLQVLVAAAVSAKQIGSRLIVRDPSDVLLNAIVDLGLGDVILVER
jgi:anti-anti-sigma regulatory factor